MVARRSRAKAKAGADKPVARAGKPKKADREFISEAEEILERMREDLADFQDQRGSQREVDPDLVNRIFRSAHSLKGLAGMFGLDAIGELAHHMEDVLDGLRLGRISMDAPAVELLDDAVSLLTSLLAQLGTAADDESSLAAVAALVDRIEIAVNEPIAEPDEFGSLNLDASLLRALTEYEEHRLRESIRRGRHLALVDTTFEIIAFEEGLSELSAAVREVGEVVSTLPSPGAAPESQIRFSLLVASDVPCEQFSARLDLSHGSVREVYRPAGATPLEPAAPAEKPQAAIEEVSTVEVAGDAADEIADDSVRSAAAPVGRVENAEIESLKSISDTVRVDIGKLDELMNLVGELVIQRNAIASIAVRLTANGDTSRIGAELSKTHKLLDRKLKELQAGVLDVRMVPLRQIFEKLSRVVRRLRRDQDKNVSLEFKGADTELDKLIVEQLVDPLMHVVRNAFDHAIEEPADRLLAGKPAQASILVQAFQRGNHVVIEVVDDGRGIDPSKVRAVAEARGLVSRDEVLTAKETLNLVFSPGLSTREEVSETSGRGVGMDVARSNLAALGGMVDISSRHGHGTSVTMTLPITLAIIQALIVGVGDQRFAIPLNSVLETLLVGGSEVQHSEGRQMLNLRGEALLLRRLGDEFQIPSAGTNERQYVVVLGMGEQRMGLLVDRLEGQQDTVMKPIKGPVRQIPGIAGATELGDRGVILVIDVSYLVAELVRRKEAA